MPNLSHSLLPVVACLPLVGGVGLSGCDEPGFGYDDPSVQALLDLPSEPYNYSDAELPEAFLDDDVVRRINTPDFNPITDSGATLGRVLFYDPALSAARTISCSSCHSSETTFSDQRRLSEGFEGASTHRNSMSLVNVRYYQRGTMFWDERAASVEEQVLMPIQDPVEMGLDLDGLVARIEATEHYPVLFELAFGDDRVSSERVAAVLAQFVRSITSTNSRYDVGLAAAGNPMSNFSNFTPEENLGKTLFFAAIPEGGAGCAGCHVAHRGPSWSSGNAVVFQMDRARNNGLYDVTESDDRGLGGVTENVADDGLFKSPTLRNVALSAPYMHDGSLATLREVVEHYNSGIRAHPNLDLHLKTPEGTPVRLGLTELEMDALVAFLKTLTDEGPGKDPRFANPFR